MRRFFIPTEKISGNRAVLDGAEAHHLRTVMRMGPGDRVTVFDGAGHAYQAVISSSDGKQVWLDLTEKQRAEHTVHLEIAMAQGYLKDKKMDGLIRPLTELGLTRWVPFMAGRSVPVPDARRLEARAQRWRKLALQAMKQCRRNQPLTIDYPCSFGATLAQSEAYDLKLLFWEKADTGLRLEPSQHRVCARVFLLVGPEGGFGDAEVKLAQERGFQVLGMGPRILRAETAAVAACALVQYVWGDMGKSVQGR